ncbi:MAG: flagellar export protein FliJ [Alphaproteobacteria bacterium]
MSWTDSLIKLAGYEVEVLQKRLAEIVDRRLQAEMRLVMLEAQGESEALHAKRNPEAAQYHMAFVEGLRTRKALAQIEIDRILLEEAGARDALALAFEEQKKYEQVAETHRLDRLKTANRIETAAMDEMGLRRTMRL